MSDGCSVREAEAGDFRHGGRRERIEESQYTRPEREETQRRATHTAREGGGSDVSDGVQWKNRKGRM